MKTHMIKVNPLYFYTPALRHIHSHVCIHESVGLADKVPVKHGGK